VAQVGGRLPAGLDFDAGNFRVTGTPIESGFFNATFLFTDAGGSTLETTNYFFIDGGASTVQIYTDGNLGTITLDSFYSNQLSACCALSYIWTLVGGSMPPGIGLSASGQLIGTATRAGTYVFQVQAADPNNSVHYGVRQFTLIVTPLSIAANNDLPDGFVNTPYNAPLTGCRSSRVTSGIQSTDQVYRIHCQSV
jgi:hypothetical protein